MFWLRFCSQRSCTPIPNEFAHIRYAIQLVSGLDSATRALVTLLRTLAAIYGVELSVTRDPKDAVVRKACRTLSRKACGKVGVDTFVLVSLVLKTPHQCSESSLDLQIVPTGSGGPFMYERHFLLCCHARLRRCAAWFRPTVLGNPLPLAA